jgi:hypothetical protein
MLLMIMGEATPSAAHAGRQARPQRRPPGGPVAQEHPDTRPSGTPDPVGYPPLSALPTHATRAARSTVILPLSIKSATVRVMPSCAR